MKITENHEFILALEASEDWHQLLCKLPPKICRHSFTFIGGALFIDGYGIWKLTVALLGITLHLRIGIRKIDKAMEASEKKMKEFLEENPKATTEEVIKKASEILVEEKVVDAQDKEA